jgi:putative phosphoribosyl transferase
MFYDRNEAATKLSEKLIPYKGKLPLVLAIPKGALPMAKIIADRLNGDLDVVLVRKLRAPHSPELAIGSVDENGNSYIAEFAALAGADIDYIEYEKRTQLDIIHKRRLQYSSIRPSLDPKGRVAIVVDDGLATGATMISALCSIRKNKPAKLVCAIPVASKEALKKISAFADEVVCLETPRDFQAVAAYYTHFPQIEDDEVIHILQCGMKIPTS